MITFTDKKKYLKGVGTAIGTDDAGNVVYYSDKFSAGNYTTSVTMGEIRAGIGNAVAAIIPSDASVNVELTAADFSLAMKASQVGAKLSYAAPDLVCETVTASAAALSIAKTEGTPVAGLGYDSIFCYVQEIGAASAMATGGTAYALNASTGAITGFTATAGKQYKVFYYVSRAEAQVAELTTAMDPEIMHLTVAWPVYTNVTSDNGGTRCGTLYGIVPKLKLGANGGVTGDQSNPDTTSVSGQALAADDTVVTADCNDCSGAGATLAYYVYVPCSDAETAVTGVVAKLGGVITVAKSGTVQVNPIAVMANNEIAAIDPAQCTYALTGAPSGTTVGANTGLITAGTTAGDGELTVTYVSGGTTFTDVANVSVS